MLLCKGKGCQYRKTCSRYVLGTGMTQFPGCGDTWIDHCLHARRFEKYMPVNETSDESGKTDELKPYKL